jgi:hypothetical protein
MKSFKALAFLLLLLCVNYKLHSAPPPPPTGTPACWPPPCVPIDGGVSFLIVAGAAYGAKKLYDQRKKNTKFS